MGTKSYKELRWILRGLSALLIVFLLIMFIGTEVLYPESGEPLSLDSNAILQLSVMGIVLIGLGLAWKWELAGGIIALAGFAGLSIINPVVLATPLLYFYPGTAILFILHWVLENKETTKYNISP